MSRNHEKSYWMEDEERLLTEKQRAENLSDDMREVSGSSIESDLNMTYLIDRYLASAISPEVLRENIGKH